MRSKLSHTFNEKRQKIQSYQTRNLVFLNVVSCNQNALKLAFMHVLLPNFFPRLPGIGLGKEREGRGKELGDYERRKERG
jgi:hypothetical protein